MIPGALPDFWTIIYHISISDLLVSFPSLPLYLVGIRVFRPQIISNENAIISRVSKQHLTRYDWRILDDATGDDNQDPYRSYSDLDTWAFCWSLMYFLVFFYELYYG